MGGEARSPTSGHVPGGGGDGPQLQGLSAAEWRTHLRLRRSWSVPELVEQLGRGGLLPEQLPDRSHLLAAAPQVRVELGRAVTSQQHAASPYVSHLFRELVASCTDPGELLTLISAAPAVWVDAGVIELVAALDRPELDRALAARVGERPQLLDLLLRVGTSRRLHDVAFDAFALTVGRLIDDLADAGGTQPASVFDEGSAAERLLTLLGLRRSVPHDGVVAASTRALVLAERDRLPAWVWLGAVGYLTPQLWHEARTGASAGVSGAEGMRHLLVALLPLGDRCDPSIAAEVRAAVLPQGGPRAGVSAPAARPVKRGIGQSGIGQSGIGQSGAGQRAVGQRGIAPGAARRALWPGDGGVSGWESLVAAADDRAVAALRAACSDGDVAAAVLTLDLLAGPVGPDSYGVPGRDARARAVARLATQLWRCHPVTGADVSRLWDAALPLLGTVGVLPMAAFDRTSRHRLWDRLDQLSFVGAADRDAAPTLPDVTRAPAAWLGDQLAGGGDDSGLLRGLLAAAVPACPDDAYRLALSLLDTFPGTVGDLVAVCRATLTAPGEVAAPARADTFPRSSTATDPEPHTVHP